MLETTICEIISEGKILLKLATRGVSKGKWNGPGGKMDAGETSKECVVREVMEETGLKLNDPKEIGILKFYKEGKEDLFIISHLFLATKFDGKLTESEEGELKWFDIKEIPYDKMWADDILWFPLLLSEKRFDAEFIFDEEMAKVTSYVITERK